jgi:C-terminal processing protease CtpA/Prc
LIYLSVGENKAVIALKRLFFFLLLVSNFTFGQTKYQKDFLEFWNGVNDHYAYLKQQNINWIRVREIYQPLADTISNNTAFIKLLESVLNELYNGHSSLNTNLNSSNRLIPTGSDMFVEKINGKYIITDLRKDFPAELSGLKTGMEIISFNDKPVNEQLKYFLPKFTAEYNSGMMQYAINMLFAGTHDTPRKISVLENGAGKVFYPDNFKPTHSDKTLESKLLNGKTGYIKIINSLGNNDLIGEFDKALDSFFKTKNLIIDLTETPSGGNTTVARAIMGRFIGKMLPYQQHEVDEPEFSTKRYWVEYVVPRKAIYNGKVFILVGHWTGSMGEGIAIGFDGMKRATIIGTRMAGLLGAIEGFRLTETQIGYQIPTEKLYHINGTPREKFIPKILTKNTKETFKEVGKIN